MNNFINQITSNPIKIFLLDGVGAMISAFFLGVVLTHYQSLVGMPLDILYRLALFPIVFMIYSFSCYFLNVKKWQLFLKIIVAYNLIYCNLSISLVLEYYHELTTLGLIYFIIELMILIGLIAFEAKMAFQR